MSFHKWTYFLVFVVTPKIDIDRKFDEFAWRSPSTNLNWKRFDTCKDYYQLIIIKVQSMLKTQIFDQLTSMFQLNVPRKKNFIHAWITTPYILFVKEDSTRLYKTKTSRQKPIKSYIIQIHIRTTTRKTLIWYGLTYYLVPD